MSGQSVCSRDKWDWIIRCCVWKHITFIFLMVNWIRWNWTKRKQFTAQLKMMVGNDQQTVRRSRLESVEKRISPRTAALLVLVSPNAWVKQRYENQVVEDGCTVVLYGKITFTTCQLPWSGSRSAKRKSKHATTTDPYPKNLKSIRIVQSLRLNYKLFAVMTEYGVSIRKEEI